MREDLAGLASPRPALRAPRTFCASRTADGAHRRAGPLPPRNAVRGDFAGAHAPAPEIQRAQSPRVTIGDRGACGRRSTPDALDMRARRARACKQRGRGRLYCTNCRPGLPNRVAPRRTGRLTGRCCIFARRQRTTPTRYSAYHLGPRHSVSSAQQDGSAHRCYHTTTQWSCGRATTTLCWSAAWPPDLSGGPAMACGRAGQTAIIGEPTGFGASWGARAAAAAGGSWPEGSGSGETTRPTSPRRRRPE